jgi:threonine dehydrogenase-like Zn-dependent dehydrogenase
VSDAIVRVVLACVCGSDLWYYRGDSRFAPGPIGHELIGVVEDVGAEVTGIREGQLVISPFAFSDGTCPRCRRGIHTACSNGASTRPTATAVKAKPFASRSPWRATARSGSPACWPPSASAPSGSSP